MAPDDGVDIAGPSDAPAIVLVHGSVVSRKMWLPQLRGLSHVCRVVAPDLPGHGAQAHLPFSMDAAVAHLDHVICEHAGGRAMVAGLSLGGYTAIELAAQRPDRVAALVLSGCSVNFTGILGAYLRAITALMRAGWLRQSRQSAERKTRRMFPPELSDVADAQMQAGVFPEALAPAFGALAGRDFTGSLRGFRGPVLILNGERDRPSRVGERKFLAALARGRIETIAGAGHACSIEQADAYNRAVIGFAREIGWVTD